MSKSIEFTCWEKDKPLEIQLEPEAILFTVAPNSSIRFEAVNPMKNFKWTLRITHQDEGVQLFPDGDLYEGIKIYSDEQLIDEWST